MEYKITINTNQDFLNSIGKEITEVLNICQNFADLIGKKFFELFPLNIETKDINKILYSYDILKTLEKCEGFQRHIKEYNKNEFSNHLFTARVANFLLSRGFEIELEPNMQSKSCPHPDIKFKKGDIEGFAECKRSKISKYFDVEKKRKIPDLVMKYIPTCDQLDLYFYDIIDMSIIETVLSDKELLKKINSFYIPGKDKQENHIWVSENFKIGIIQQPTIIGNPDSFPEITMNGFLVEHNTELKMIGDIFQLKGRSISVFSVLDYTNKLRDKKEQSAKQIIKDKSNIIFLCYSDVFGDPDSHKRYIETEWFNENKPDLSGIAFYENFHEGSKKIDYFKYYENPNANFKISFNN